MKKATKPEIAGAIARYEQVCQLAKEQIAEELHISVTEFDKLCQKSKHNSRFRLNLTKFDKK